MVKYEQLKNVVNNEGVHYLVMVLWTLRMQRYPMGVDKAVDGAKTY